MPDQKQGDRRSPLQPRRSCRGFSGWCGAVVARAPGGRPRPSLPSITQLTFRPRPERWRLSTAQSSPVPIPCTPRPRLFGFVGQVGSVVGASCGRPAIEGKSIPAASPQRINQLLAKSVKTPIRKRQHQIPFARFPCDELRNLRRRIECPGRLSLAPDPLDHPPRVQPLCIAQQLRPIHRPDNRRVGGRQRVGPFVCEQIPPPRVRPRRERRPNPPPWPGPGRRRKNGRPG